MLKIIVCTVIVLGSYLSAAAQEIKGQVFNNDNRALAGATIACNPCKNTVSSNSEGKFSITIESLPVTVTISFTGYARQIIRLDKLPTALLIVKLQPASVDLGEVIVSNGFQARSADKLTGSYEKLDNALLNRSVSTDILSRIDGVASSVFFSKTATRGAFTIRGLSTLTANTDPLIVVDNFVYDGSINNINPNDVESISILRDAEASAIWGARAGNGVVVITTKKGKYNKPLKVALNINTTTTNKPLLYKDRGFTEASSFIDVERFLYGKGYYNSQLINTSTRPIISPVVELLAKQTAGQVTVAEAEAQLAAWRGMDVRSDYLAYIYRKASNTQYALNLSGGGSSNSYFIGIGYDDNRSTTVGNISGRSTVTTGFNFRVSKAIEIQTGINYAYTKTIANGLDNIQLTGKSRLYPYARFADEKGNALAIDKEFRGAYTDTAGGGLLLNWKYKPLEEQQLADNSRTLQDIVFKLGIQYQIIKQLQLELRGQLEQASTTGENIYSTGTYFTRSLINRFSTRTGNSIKRNIPLGAIRDNTDARLKAYAGRAQLNYAGSIGRRHQLSGLAGTEIKEAYNVSRTGRVYGYDGDLLLYGNVNYDSVYSQYGNVGGKVYIPSNIAFSEGVNRFISFFGNLSYTYNNKYTVSGSARKDASNLFGVATNSKWNPFWSAGLAWNISSEKFYGLKFLPLLKLRASYGYGGNVKNDIPAVATVSYSPGFDNITGLPYADIKSLPNPLLRWEKAGMLNIGIDWANRDGRLRGSVEYFRKRSTDLLANTPIDPTLGFNNMVLNSANLSGKGIDIKLNARVLDRRLKWDLTLIGSYVTNKVTRNLLKATTLGVYAGSGNNISSVEGYDPYSIFSYRWGGLDSIGDPVGYLNGVRSKDYASMTTRPALTDLVRHGSSRPPYFFNLLNTFEFKGFSISLNIAGRMGYYFRKSTIEYGVLFSNWIGNVDFDKRWQKPGDESITSVPALSYPANSNRDKFYALSEATVLRGDHIRLKDINISYTAPAFKAGKKTVDNLQLYAYLNNLGILWRANKEKIDPEYGNGMPNPFAISFGLKAQF